jgi:hypothetical protein
MPEVETEWAEVASGLVVVAFPGRVRIHHPAPWDLDDPLIQPMTGPGRPATTGALLRGACYAPLAGRSVPLEIPRSLPRFIFRLAGAWHTTRVTPPTLRALAERFRAEGRETLSRYCLDKAQEETGHDRLALRDLEALGLPAAAVVDVLRPSVSLAFARYHEAAAQSDRPLRALGYAFCLEWVASLQGPQDLEALRRVLPEGHEATRCFRLHSGLGSDKAHVEELVDLVAGLSAAERAETAVGAFETAAILIEHAGDEPPDEAIEAQLEAVRRDRISQDAVQPRN